MSEGVTTDLTDFLVDPNCAAQVIETRTRLHSPTGNIGVAVMLGATCGELDIAQLSKINGGSAMEQEMQDLIDEFCETCPNRPLANSSEVEVVIG